MKEENNNCTCPPPSKLEDMPYCCPDNIIGQQYGKIRLYGASKVALDEYANYLGQFEFIKSEMRIKITKQPYVVLVAFNQVTGEATFFDCTDNPRSMLVTHTEPIISYCEIPNENQKQAVEYFDLL